MANYTEGCLIHEQAGFLYGVRQMDSLDWLEGCAPLGVS